MGRATCVVAAVLMLAACGPRQNQLQQFRTTSVSPAELAVQPGQPLVMPPTNALPAPRS